MHLFILDMFLVGIGIILSTAFLASIVHLIVSTIFGRSSRDSYKIISTTIQKNWRGIGVQSKRKM
ncbi:hypothetical protein [Pontibacillus yanchengensis]|uniref:Uncharacterized protein n=1 Tax=Pontibacillus yanchengensis Y32 TaxID=1385514 RepID=A0A0A2TFQ2_9BACI|nr:hypothetical protein [Pontibacillus yanchengensis]KGP74354.1 hypothetical protein N782_15535 [Pontibacillus yanchengensis Y32]